MYVRAGKKKGKERKEGRKKGREIGEKNGVLMMNGGGTWKRVARFQHLSGKVARKIAFAVAFCKRSL